MAYTAIRILVHILILILQVHGTEAEKAAIIPPTILEENKDHTQESCIIQIRSDEALDETIRYSLYGKGASDEPFDRFTVDPVTGCVKVNSILDREEIAFYSLKGVATFPDGTPAEKDLELRIPVQDVNDNQPVFEVSQTTGAVNESSAADTYVMTVSATDADEGVFAEIAYSIVEQRPPGGSNMFFINKETGQIRVKLNTLDRETQDTYSLTIKAADSKGSATGLSQTATFVVRILDINDNIPRLEKNYYETEIMENIFDVTALRIKALDADLIHTDNWLAVFTIVSGNEAGYFSISTDPETNEGILVLKKALDYEEKREVSLQIAVSNRAEYHSSVVITKKITYPIKIHVQNEREGSRFQPAVKVAIVSEKHTSINEVITTYKAIDTDTMQDATNVIYLIGEDKYDWITIDKETAEIRLNMLPDRESKYLVNGTYYAKIISITEGMEGTAKGTATGTIAIQVQDYNDNYPTLTSIFQTVSFGENVVYVTAVDRDPFPNGAPFEFKISPNTKEQWSVERLNDTSVILRPEEILWPGFYKVFLVIRDQQGKASANEQVIELEVCRGTDYNTCLPWEIRQPRITLGPATIILLLCLLPLLLLFFRCESTRSFKAMPISITTKPHLISYHTEGPGEDKKVPVLLVTPAEAEADFIKSSHGSAAFAGLVQTDKVFHDYSQEASVLVTPIKVDSGLRNPSDQQTKGSGYGSRAFAGLALSEGFLHEYYSQKARCIEQLQSAEAHEPEDSLLVYGYEGHKSPVGSLGCCSQLQDDHSDLDFLDDLGPKFKTLANICSSEAIVHSSKAMVTAPPPPPSAPQVDIRVEILENVSPAKAETNCLASLSALIQESIDSATCSSTHLATSTVQLEENLVIPTQNLLIPQPSVPCNVAAPPVCVMDPIGPKPHPTLLVSPAVNTSETLVMVERRATTEGSVQHQSGGQRVVGVVENLHGTQGLVLLGHGESAAGDPHQIISTLGSREVVMVQTQKGLESGSVKQMSEIYGDTLTMGNVALSESTSAGSGRLQHVGTGGLIRVLQVVPSQSHSSPRLQVRGLGSSLNVPLAIVQQGSSTPPRNLSPVPRWT